MSDAADPLSPEALRSELAYQGGYGKYGDRNEGERAYEVAGVYCPCCKAARRVNIARLYPFDVARDDDDEFSYPVIHGDLVINVKCLQCQTEAIGLLKKSDNACDERLQLYWPIVANLATPRTPPAVAYYLEQASLCLSVRAYTAAVVMFRSALEHLLHQQNYQKGMLGNRLNALLCDVEAEKAPKWAREIDHAYLDVINKLGNGAIHANDGDSSKQQALDEELLIGLEYAFGQILEVVYERPAKDEANLAKLRNASSIFKK